MRGVGVDAQVDPEAIQAVHLDYYRADAKVATTASYQASIEGFEAAGSDRETALGGAFEPSAAAGWTRLGATWLGGGAAGPGRPTSKL